MHQIKRERVILGVGHVSIVVYWHGASEQTKEYMTCIVIVACSCLNHNYIFPIFLQENGTCTNYLITHSEQNAVCVRVKVSSVWLRSSNRMLHWITRWGSRHGNTAESPSSHEGKLDPLNFGDNKLRLYRSLGMHSTQHRQGSCLGKQFISQWDMTQGVKKKTCLDLVIKPFQTLGALWQEKSYLHNTERCHSELINQLICGPVFRMTSSGNRKKFSFIHWSPLQSWISQSICNLH